MRTRQTAPLLALVTLLMACSQPGPDTTAPTILSSTPANAATGVAASASLSIHFSEAMDKTTIAVTPNPAINLGAPVWNDAQTVVFSPSVAWSLGSSYTIGVEGKDTSGNALGGPKTFSFQTVSAPDSTPPATPSSIKATAGDGAFALEWNANTEADLEGYTVYWGVSASALGSAVFIAKPTTITSITGLENAKAYFYAVDAVDASGNHSVKSSPVSITPVDETAPTLKSSEPANGTQDIALVPTLRLTFSEPMNTTNFNLNVCTTSGPPITVTCPIASIGPRVIPTLGMPTWSNNDTQVQYSPSSDYFKGGQTYVVNILAQDKAGNALLDKQGIAFATRATPDTTPPTLSNFGSDVTDPTATLSFTFSEPMDQQSVQSAFLSQPHLNCTWSWSGNTATCQTGVLRQSTTYTVTIGTLAKDTAQNALVSSVQKTFNVGNLLPRVTKFAPNPNPNVVGFFAPNEPIILTFSEPMDTISAQSAFLVKVGANIIPGSFDWSDPSAEPGTVMKFTPSTSYGRGATVTWKLTYAASDVTQIPMAADVTHSFQTLPLIALGTSR